MKKFIVTLKSGPSASVEVPEETKSGSVTRKVERCKIGAIRLFAGVPTTVSEDELKLGIEKRSDLKGKYLVRTYVESKRVDRRGATEAEIEAASEAEGISHLSLSKQVDRLHARGKIGGPRSSGPSVTVRKPKNGNGNSGGK